MRPIVCTQMKLGFDNGLFIYARDGAGLLILKRETREAAEKKVRELDDMGCFEVEIVEEADAKAA